MTSREWYRPESLSPTTPTVPLLCCGGILLAEFTSNSTQATSAFCYSWKGHNLWLLNFIPSPLVGTDTMFWVFHSSTCLSNCLCNNLKISGWTFTGIIIVIKLDRFWNWSLKRVKVTARAKISRTRLLGSFSFVSLINTIIGFIIRTEYF